VSYVLHSACIVPVQRETYVVSDLQLLKLFSVKHSSIDKMAKHVYPNPFTL